MNSLCRSIRLLKMPELKVEVRSQYVQGKLAIVVWNEGSGSARAAEK